MLFYIEKKTAVRDAHSAASGLLLGTRLRALPAARRAPLSTRPAPHHPVTLAPPGAMAEKRIIVELEEGWSFMEARGREAGDAREYP